MSKQDTVTSRRRSLLGGAGLAALAALAATPAGAEDKPGKFVPKRHALDAWMDEMPGDHRVFIDTADNNGGTDALRYASNLLTAHVNDYKGKEADMAIVICYRHASTVLGFNDAMWQKFGTSFARLGQLKLKDGETPAKNPELKSITDIGARGVKFAICNTATTMMAGFIAREAKLQADDVHAELVANLIPNARMVPAGVIAATRAQEYGYSLLYSA
ncbi:MAG TPA: hypothetical protein VMH83_11455 [Candidatus Acidoferrum sp.]|nr:hypothetical protein [Candidatus Acidoferrum sp.]